MSAAGEGDAQGKRGEFRFTVAETIKTEGRFTDEHRIGIGNADGQMLDTLYFAMR